MQRITRLATGPVLQTTGATTRFLLLLVVLYTCRGLEKVSRHSTTVITKPSSSLLTSHVGYATLWTKPHCFQLQLNALATFETWYERVAVCCPLMLPHASTR